MSDTPVLQSPVDWASAAAELVAASQASASEVQPAEPEVVVPVPAPQAAAPGQTPAPIEPAVDSAQPSEQPVSVGRQISSLARQEREVRDREAKLRAKEEAVQAKEKEWETKFAKLGSGSKEFLEDTVGWLEAQGVPKDQWVEVAESIYFALSPDKAPPELRIQQMDRRLRREQEAWRKAQTEAQEKAESARIQAQADAQKNAYRMVLTSHVETTAEKYPASRAWFGEDSSAWHETLMSTATNLAVSAEEAGSSADLSPQHIADEVEAYLASRFARWTPPTPTPPTPTQAAPQTKATPQTKTAPIPPPRDIDNSVEAREARAAAIWAERRATNRSGT